MGIRSLQVPQNAQPQDLPGPVPTGGEPTFQDAVANAPKLPQQPNPPPQAQGQSQQGGPSFSDVAGGPSPASTSQPASPPPTQSPKDDPKAQADAIAAEFQSKEADTAHFQQASHESDVEAIANEFGNSTPAQSKDQLDTAAQAAAGMARTPTGRLSALQNHYGKTNVSYANGVYTIKTANGNITTSDDALESWFNIRNYSGGTLEMGVGAAGTALAGAGMAEAGATGAFLAGGAGAVAAGGEAGALGGPLGVVAGATAAGIGFGAAHLFRDAVNKNLLSIQESADYNAGQEAMKMGGFAFVGDALLAPVVSAAGKNIAAGISRVTDMLTQAAPSTRIEAAQTVRLALNQTLQDLKIPLTTLDGKVSADAPAIAKDTQTAVDAARKYYSSRVGLVDTKAVELATKNNLKFQPTNLMKEIKGQIGNYVVEGADGRLSLSIGTQSADPLAAGEFEADNAGLRATQSAAFGDPQGMSAVKDMMARYNVLLDASNNGGIRMQDIQNQVKLIGNIPDTWGGTSRKSADLVSALKSTYQAAANDRDAAYLATLKGTDEGNMFTTAYKEFSSRIDAITRIQGKYDNQGAFSSGVMDAYMQPRNPTANSNLQDLLKILGPDSKQANNLRGNWISDRINEAIDVNKPVFDANKFIQGISEDKWGQDFTNTLFPGGAPELNGLKLMAKRAEGIATSDLWANDTAGQEAVIKMSMANRVVGGMARTMYRLVRTNPDLATYLSEKGLADYAQKLGTPEAIQSFMKEADIFKAVVDSSTTVDAQSSKIFQGAQVAGKAVKRILVPISKQAFREAFGGAGGYNPNTDLARKNAEASSATQNGEQQYNPSAAGAGAGAPVNPPGE